MRFVPTIKQPRYSVRTRLSLAFLLVTSLSWALGFVTLRFLMEQDLNRMNREMAARAAQSRIRVGPMGNLFFGEPPGPMDRNDGRPDFGPPGRQDGGPQFGPGDERNGRPEFQKPPANMPPGHGPAPGPWRPIYQSVWAQCIISVILAVLAGWYVSLRFSRPLASLATGARALHNRDYTHRIPITGTDEFADVAATMNEMAAEVGTQIKELEDDAKRRKQILADVAHELRSPVATLEAMTAALQDGLAEQPERRLEALTFMRSSTERMKRLVNDLMEVARLDMNEVPLLLAPTDLRELVEDVVSTHRESAADAGIDLTASIGEENVSAQLDRLRISQVLDNLVENAISYAGSGVKITVSVISDPVGFIVEDTGKGIPVQDLPFIFDPFYRADAARTPGDNHSGLGLRISRGLVEAHGGSMNLESHEGKGTRIVITFPPEPVNVTAAG